MSIINSKPIDISACPHAETQKGHITEEGLICKVTLLAFGLGTGRKIGVVLACLICLGWEARNAWAVSSIQHIGCETNTGQVRITLDLDSLPDFTAYKQDSRHIIIELTDTVQTSSGWNLKVGNWVDEIRLVRKDSRTLGIVVDLQADAHFNAASGGGQDGALPHIIIDVIPAPAVNLPAPTNTADTNSSGSIKVIPVCSVKLVVIDAGHGGADPGAIGPDGVKEKDVVLAIALKLYRELKSNPKFDVRLTRDGDYFVPLWDRVEFTRKCRADLFVSIHANANTDSDYRGASVYYLSETASDKVAQLLAEKENAADLLGGSSSIRDQSSRALFINLNQISSYRESLLLGQKVVQQYRQVRDVAMQEQLRSAPFAVLKSLSVPSILLETAFISNPQEEKYLTSDAFQQKLAHSLAQAIHEYFFELPSGQVHTVKAGETLWRISQQYGLTPNQLRLWNNLAEQDPIYSGQRLKLAVQ